MASVLAGMCTAYFNQCVYRHMPEYSDRLPHFDCRVISMPNKTEVANMFLWRELDATKNAVSMAARSVYSHKELQNQNCSEMQEMLFAKGINFNDYPTEFKRGTWVRRVVQERPLTDEERNKVPEKYRPSEGKKVIRATIEKMNMPKFNTVANRVEVIFDGHDPILKE